jgi:hypothetical protein
MSRWNGAYSDVSCISGHNHEIVFTLTTECYPLLVSHRQQLICHEVSKQTAFL